MADMDYNSLANANSGISTSVSPETPSREALANYMLQQQRMRDAAAVGLLGQRDLVRGIRDTLGQDRFDRLRNSPAEERFGPYPDGGYINRQETRPWWMRLLPAPPIPFRQEEPPELMRNRLAAYGDADPLATNDAGWSRQPIPRDWSWLGRLFNNR